MRRGCRMLVVASVLLGATGCTGSEHNGGDTPADEAVLMVVAPLSLERAFAEIVDAFEAEHPEVDVRITFDATDRLPVTESSTGPTDLLVASDRETMDAAAAAGLLGSEPVFVAGNLLTVVTRTGEGAAFMPGGDGLASLEAVALCDATTACGRITGTRLAGLFDEGILNDANVLRRENELATVDAVIDGEADAAVVYGTEAAAAGEAVEIFELGMDEQSPDTEATIAVLEEARDPALAQIFVDFLGTEASLDILSAAGFWVGGRGSSWP